MFRQGDPPSHLYIIVRGELKVIAQSSNGREACLALMSAGDVFGELALLDPTGGRSASVVTITEAELLLLRHEDFLAFMSRTPTAAVRLLQLLAGKIKALSGRVEDVSFLGLPQRLAKVLLDLSTSHGKRLADGSVTVELKLSQKELGDLAHGTRESVNKLMRAWSHDGLISYERGRLSLYDEDTLHSLSAPYES